MIHQLNLGAQLRHICIQETIFFLEADQFCLQIFYNLMQLLNFSQIAVVGTLCLIQLPKYFGIVVFALFQIFFHVIQVILCYLVSLLSG